MSNIPNTVTFELLAEHLESNLAAIAHWYLTPITPSAYDIGRAGHGEFCERVWSAPSMMAALVECEYLDLIMRFFERGATHYFRNIIYLACRYHHMPMFELAMCTEPKDDIKGGYLQHSHAWCSHRWGHIAFLADCTTYFGSPQVWGFGLFGACEGGHIDLIDRILPIIADKNRPNANEMGLIGACAGGHVAIAREMIDRGASRINEGLFEARLFGQDAAATYMISCGAYDAISRLVTHQKMKVGDRWYDKHHGRP